MTGKRPGQPLFFSLKDHLPTACFKTSSRLSFRGVKRRGICFSLAFYKKQIPRCARNDSLSGFCNSFYPFKNQKFTDVAEKSLLFAFNSPNMLVDLRSAR